MSSSSSQRWSVNELLVVRHGDDRRLLLETNGGATRRTVSGRGAAVEGRLRYREVDPKIFCASTLRPTVMHGNAKVLKASHPLVNGRLVPSHGDLNAVRRLWSWPTADRLHARVLWLWPNSPNEVPVVHYDSWAAGDRRTCREGGDFWTVELFLEELENLLVYLGLNDRYFLLGQSWVGCSCRTRHSSTAGLKALVIRTHGSMALWLAKRRSCADNSIPKSSGTRSTRGRRYNRRRGVPRRPAGVLRPPRLSSRAKSS